MKRYTAILFVLSCLSLVAVAQDADDLRKKYGPPNEKGHYAVRAQVVMAVTFDKSGKITKAVITPSDLQLPSATMPTNVAQDVLNEVAPPHTRGKLKKEAGAAAGCTHLSFLEYERLTIQTESRCERQGGGVYSEHITWK